MMENFEIPCSNRENYNQRSSKSLVINLILSGMVFLIVTLKSDWTYGLLFAAFLLAVQLFMSSQRDKYYISSIVISDEEIEITYTDMNEEKSLKDSAKLFKFKKKIAFSKSRSVSMAIYYKEKLTMQQWVNGDWREDKFDEVIDASSERNDSK